ncbi:MAG: hypothetical protein JST04_05205 [Bdellovibrionales bacterium]|nr:hypothetical protein [Bdellovibrionales bacterium]
MGKFVGLGMALVGAMIAGAGAASASLGMEVKGEVVQMAPTFVKIKTARGMVKIKRDLLSPETAKAIETGRGHFRGFVPKDAVDHYYPAKRKVQVRT